MQVPAWECFPLCPGSYSLRFSADVVNRLHNLLFFLKESKGHKVNRGLGFMSINILHIFYSCIIVYIMLYIYQRPFTYTHAFIHTMAGEFAMWSDTIKKKDAFFFPHHSNAIVVIQLLNHVQLF